MEIDPILLTPGVGLSLERFDQVALVRLGDFARRDDDTDMSVVQVCSERCAPLDQLPVVLARPRTRRQDFAGTSTT